MGDATDDPRVRARRGAARYLELLFFLGMGAVFLPFYAVFTGAAWLLTGRGMFGGGQWVLLLAVYWIVEVLITVTLLWRYRKSGRTQPDAFAVGQILGSVVAWSVASGFESTAIAVGLFVGCLYAAAHAMFAAFTDNLSEEESREKVRGTLTNIAVTVTDDRPEDPDGQASGRTV